MCTVTFVPTANGIYLTSSRDEHYKRSKALPPQFYYRNGYELIFPKDPDAGGTWIALRNKKEAAVLLNGAFLKHLPEPPYRKSRGIVLLDVLAYSDPVIGFNTLLLSGIEPFTLILLSEGKLTECRWDGKEKHQQQLDINTPRIWSSVTLYDETVIKQREAWFKQWFQGIEELNTEEMMHFHQFAGDGDSRNSVLMNRDNQMSTVSICSLFIGKGQSRIRYRDVQSMTDLQHTFSHERHYTAKESLWDLFAAKVKRVSIRFGHWEYWPSYLIYFPVYFYWLWLSIKARSFFFFSAANPSIHHSGFAQERKSDIYSIIPQQYYPRTLLCEAGADGHKLHKLMAAKNIRFPIIAKPDIGERGVQVKLLHSASELKDYGNKSKVAFLIQEFISYEHEVGIFYYRIPGENSGHISGIVGKEFLTVTGDGVTSIEGLLKINKRYLLQLPALRFTYGSFLDTVLEAGKEHVLVPYGNHSRGSKFIDESWRITDALSVAVDRICQQIPGFYYGRLDIKFRSWDTLLEGKELSIIELNGAGSEPTHIYDPSHSLLFAWKEVCRHWKLLFQISRLNAKQKGLQLMTFSDGVKMQQDRRRYLKLIEQ